jgi:hypothetical protein
MAKEKTTDFYFKMSQQEWNRVEQRMVQTHITNLRAYFLKQAIDDRDIHIELESVQECSRLLSSIANNVNQPARKANSGGNIYAADLRGVR